MSLRFSLKDFPLNGHVKDESGLPWGCTVQPLAEQENYSVPFIGGLVATDIPRCEKCHGYISPCATVQQDNWWCPLCGYDNPLPERYKSGGSFGSNPLSLPELVNPVIEYCMDAPEQGPVGTAEAPIFVAMVDISSSAANKAYLEAVRNALFAMVEALPESALFGIMTFSDSIGVFNLFSPVPHIHNIPVPSNSKPALSLEEVLSFRHFLVPVGEYNENIIRAIDALSKLNIASGNRCFGSAAQMIVDYFGLYDMLNVRILSFLSGSPNYGHGAIPDVPLPIAKSADGFLNPAISFYRDLAITAVEAGICFDLCILAASSKSSVGLPTTKFLSIYTGGNISFYDPEDVDSFLPQDVFRWYSSDLGFHGLLRLRCSKEFKIHHQYGHAHADSNFDDLFHIQGCDKWKTFAFDFQYTSPAGFNREARRPPCLQMAFAYGYLPGIESAQANGISRQRVEKRLRIHTVQLGMATDFASLYKGADAEAISCLLTHKLTRAAFDEGIKEARLLLQDWLTILFTLYNEQLEHAELSRLRREGLPPPKEVPLQMTFDVFPHLRMLPRYIFALTKSALFSATQNLGADQWTYIHCLYSGLNPSLLRRALYPVMSTFGAPNNLASSQIMLSKTALESSGSHIFLLDALNYVFVYYDAEVDPSTPFPPPKDSLIRTSIDALKQERICTPKVIMIKANDLEEGEFFSYLVEEQTQSGVSFTRYLQTCTDEVRKTKAKSSK